MKILILKSFGLGNQIMLTPVIKALHEAGHEVSLLSDNGPLGFPSSELFSGWKYLKDIVEFNREKARDGNDIVVWFKKCKFDICIQSFPADNLFDWLFPLIDIPVIKAKIITGFWDKHEVDYNMEMVQHLLPEKASVAYDLPFFTTDKVSKILVDINLVGKKIVVISPSYKRSDLWWKKNWGNDKYAELIHLLPKEFFPILVDGKDGIGDCNAINFMSGNKALNLAGRLNIHETMDLMNNADLVIANDSGPAHIAAAYKKKLFVFFGPTCSTKSSPISPYTYVLKSNLPCSPCQGTKLWDQCKTPDCLNVISAERVVELVKRVMNEQI